MKRIKLFKNFDKVNEISNELVRKTAKKMGEYGQNSRGQRLLDKHFDIGKIFNKGEKFGKNKRETQYYIEYSKIEEGYFLVPIISLYNDDIGGNKCIRYYSYTDEFTFDSSKFDKISNIVLNKKEVRMLCKLAKMFNPNTKYSSGTKDLPVEDYI